MQSSHISAPSPDLRVISIDHIHAHEHHDSQRSAPLVEQLRHAETIINPPIVAEIGLDHYVILDGANRFYSFQHLGYPHILVQVANYDSGYVELETWRHIVSDWNTNDFIKHLEQITEINLHSGQEANAIAHLITHNGQVYALHVESDNVIVRNALLCDVVALYQQNAVLYRTAITEPEDVWPLYPQANAIVRFPRYVPTDIIAAVRHHAYLPPGISRHIIHGRALRVNYPLATLQDPIRSLEAKNVQLQHWLQAKLAKRQVRYYAEATYQFDE